MPDTAQRVQTHPAEDRGFVRAIGLFDGAMIVVGSAAGTQALEAE
jgi:hypothetical protein